MIVVYNQLLFGICIEKFIFKIKLLKNIIKRERKNGYFVVIIGVKMIKTKEKIRAVIINTNLNVFPIKINVIQSNFFNWNYYL